MVLAIVDQVAALTQALEVTLPVIVWMVIEVGRGQDHAGLPDLRCFHEIGPADRATAAVAPRGARGVEPTNVGQIPSRLRAVALQAK